MIGLFPFYSTKTFQIAANANPPDGTVVTFSTRSDVQIRAISCYISAGTSPVGHNRTINLRPVGETKWIADTGIDIASIIGSVTPYRLPYYMTVNPSKGLEVLFTDAQGTAYTVYLLLIGLQAIDTEQTQ